MSDDETRASNPRRSRRRSLRVPVDEVPRASVPEPAPPPPKAPSTPPRPRTVPPPPPPAAVARMTDPGAFDLASFEEVARTTDPGGPAPDDEERLSLTSMEEEPAELDAEPTRVARSSERPFEAPMSTAAEATPIDAAAALAAVPSEPPPALDRAPEPQPEELAEEPSQIIEVAREEDSAPSISTSEELEAVDLDGPPTSTVELPASAADTATGSLPAEIAEAPPRSSLTSITTPSSGLIVVQRTIAIGVGTPTSTTVAKERESAPPPASEPAFELSDSEIAADAAEASFEPAPTEDRDAEVLDELEEVSDPGGKRSAPPPPPAGAPPPPPREAHRPPPPPKAPPTPPTPPAAVPSEPESGKRARKKWWEEFFNDDYFRTVPPPQPKTIVQQSAFIAARLGLPPGAALLDVGCGLGLHAVELTRMGYSVVGLDLSLPMLTRAADEAQDQGLKINFVQGDMREMSFEGTFDAVLCWGTTFGYFDDDQNRLVVERLHRALKPGGLLLLDVVNRDYVFKTQPNNVWFQGDGCIVMEESNANFINSRLTVKRQVMLDDGRQNETVYSIRLYSLHELGQLLHHRGFRVVEVSGREATPGVFFGAESPRLIITAERRPDSPSASKRPEGEALPSESQQLPIAKE